MFLKLAWFLLLFLNRPGPSVSMAAALGAETLFTFSPEELSTDQICEATPLVFADTHTRAHARTEAYLDHHVLHIGSPPG